MEDSVENCGARATRWVETWNTRHTRPPTLFKLGSLIADY
jgi:hypothetical protein